jgi:glycosyltransferase involved in cell wall biosynthesis
MRVLFFWEPVGGLTFNHPCNPYAPLLADALAEHRVALELGDYDFGRDWLEKKRDSFDVLHFHWLHYFYRDAAFEGARAKLDAFKSNIDVARTMGYRIVWTLHNLYPHERPFPDLDHEARVLLADRAAEMITHCAFAAGKACELFGRQRPPHVIPHGHFIDVFPNSVTREEARETLGLPADAFVYLFFGNARSYKGVENLTAAFRKAGGHNDRLVMMMRRKFDPDYADAVVRGAEGDDRIQVHTSEWFDNGDFQTYLNAADTAVFPFSQVLTSGSVITALSFGVPVVVPRLGCLPELVEAPAGILYDPTSSAGLSDALVRMRKVGGETARAAARRTARALDWGMIASKTAALYSG